MQIDPYLSLCTKLKSKWIKDLNINSITLYPIEEKVGNSFEYIGTGDNFLNRTPIAQELRPIFNKWDPMKLKTLERRRTLSIGHKRKPTEWEKIFTNPISVLMSFYCKDKLL